MGELTPITAIDGRVIENRNGTNVMKELIGQFEEMIPKYCITL